MIYLGAGLGVSIAEFHESGFRVIDTEAGHTSFAPASRLEFEVMEELSARFGGCPMSGCSPSRGWPSCTRP